MRKAIRDGKLQADVHGLCIFQGLCALPTLFVEQDDLISQAFRQNVKSAYLSSEQPSMDAHGAGDALWSSCHLG